MGSKDVAANPNLLPDLWWLDPMFADAAYAKIDRMLAAGYSRNTIAREVGCSSRAVERHLYRIKHPVDPAERRPAAPKPHRPLKLTLEAVREIRAADHSISGWAAPLAKKYGVHRRTVGRVASGSLWGHVPFEDQEAS